MNGYQKSQVIKHTTQKLVDAINDLPEEARVNGVAFDIDYSLPKGRPKINEATKAYRKALGLKDEPVKAKRDDFGFFLYALRSLPEQYIDDDTEALPVGSDRIIVTNPNHPPLTYTRQQGEWVQIDYKLVDIPNPYKHPASTTKH